MTVELVRLGHGMTAMAMMSRLSSGCSLATMGVGCPRKRQKQDQNKEERGPHAVIIAGSTGFASEMLVIISVRCGVRSGPGTCPSVGDERGYAIAV